MRADEHGSDSLEFWWSESVNGRFKILTKLALLVFGPPVSTTESERLFSSAGLVRIKNRSRLDPMNVEKILKLGHFLRRECATARLT